MRKIGWALGAGALFALGAVGCSHSMGEAKADYHQERADSAASHGNYYKAADQQRKADIDRDKAATAPLP